LATDGSTGEIPDQIHKEAKQRLDDACDQKRKFDADIREAYYFTAPHRAQVVSSSVKAPSSKPQFAGELQTSIAFEESENFATTLINSFMPQGMPWIDLKASVRVPEDFMQEVTERAKEHVEKTFGVMNESNFYAELGVALNPDAAVGTFAVWIDEDRMPHEPVRVNAVPLRELEINVGPNGDIDDRFMVRHTKNRFVEPLLGRKADKLPEAIRTEIREKPNAQTIVRWGFWRDWSRYDDVVWCHVIMVRDTVVHHEMLTGDGSCPLITPTFNRYPEWPYGIGPAIKALPEFRHVDDMAAGETENVDLSLRPPMTFPDDSIAQIEGGVEPGGWYPIRPGTEGAVRKMYEPNRLDAAYFDQTQRERRIRKMFYNDFPEQRGDTPPTATQWIDEMAMAQRKIGTPGLKFWNEGPREIFKRFYFLARKRGLIEPIEIPGLAAPISLQPYNPTQRAQNQQKLATAARVGQLAASFFPEEFKVAFDGGKTIDRMIELADVQDVFVKRDPKAIGQAVDQLSQLSGAGQARFPSIQPGAIGGPAPQ